MAKKNKWDINSSKTNQKDERFSPARVQNPVEEAEKEVSKEVNNTSNITINDSIVVRYGSKKDIRTAKYNVNVRKSPSFGNNIIRTASIGDKVEVLSIDGDWAKIGNNEYVMIEYFE